MINIRYGMWETNSSTVNQLVIHRGKFKPVTCTHLILKRKDVSGVGCESFTDIESKAQLIYGMAEDIREEKKSTDQYLKRYSITDPKMCYYAAKEKPRLDKISRRALSVEKMLFKVLEKHGVIYSIEKTKSDSWPGELFGMSGSFDIKDKIFSSEDSIERFLFDENSGFTFGEENIFMRDDKFGYTDKTLDEDEYDVYEF